ncbi:hypothetical protein CDD83_9317 [Cordyceps sp. RAO-2017]|nr:hypothetical protein CDD83_9317 [Cordyceps sp. RAO-2017]
MGLVFSTLQLVKLLVVASLYHGSLTSASAIPNMVVLRPPPVAPPGSVGAVASEASECSSIGKSLLARGGNAVDAIVGTTFCVGVVASYHSGIGGGGFAMLRDADGNYEAIDFRETAPAAAREDMFQGNTVGSIAGGLSVGVPGEVRGLEYIHKKYGSLPWKSVMQGAIRVARDGFRVSSDFMRYTRNADGTLAYPFLVEDPNFAQDFAPNGTLVGVGDIVTRERYARVLERISDEGSDAFYKGELAEAMIKFVEKTNGTMTLDDLRGYSVVSRPVQRVRYRGLDLFSMGVPASGAVGLSILKTMEQFPEADVNLTTHRFTEAMRFAYAARLELGDPAFVDNATALEAHILDDAYAQRVRRRISDRHTQPVRVYDPKGIYTPDSHGTSHITTADHSGMAVSLTTTVNLIFGARIMEPTSGIVLNDEMNDFSIPGVPNAFGYQPAEANFIRPGKRPLSSITPIIAAHPNGTLFAAVGAAGGSRILSSTVGALWHVVEHGMTMADAVREPRLHDQLMPNTVMLEYKFDNRTAAALRDKGHNVTWVHEGLSAVQGVLRRTDGSFEAAAEPRQNNSGGFTA